MDPDNDCIITLMPASSLKRGMVIEYDGTRSTILSAPVEDRLSGTGFPARRVKRVNTTQGEWIIPIEATVRVVTLPHKVNW
jgi:hypothetical protein